MDNRRKRVAMIIPGGIGTGPNSIGVPVLEQQVKLLANDMEVVVFSLFAVNDDYKAEGFELISIPAKSFLVKAYSVFGAFSAAHRFRKFDVIHGFWVLPCGFFAVMLGKYFRVRSVVSILGGDVIALPEIGYGQLRKYLPRLAVRWTIRNAGTVTALTQYLVNNLAKANISKNNVRIIPWGVDQQRFQFAPAPFKYPIKFLHIANFTPVKDQLTLLKAFKLITDQVSCELTIVGEGKLKVTLEKTVRDLGLMSKVTFHRPVPNIDVPAFYRDAMILLHTSMSEGQCEVVTEAMSSGVVVCGTRVGLLFDLPACCVAVSIKDHDALAHEVLRLLSDPDRIQGIRERAAEWARTHAITWTVSKTKDLYEPT
jgi:glycosyltransferase involved in cell wall biosynthesis